MTIGLIGRKVGMTRLYDGSGRVRPVTVLEVEPNRVTQLRTAERDGYTAVQIGAQGNRKRINRPERGHLRKAQIDGPITELREFRLDDLEGYTVGQSLTVEQFEPGQFVDVSGVTRGRGFAGGVRRWNFRGGPKTHGQSDRHRAPGSIGAGTTPGKVWKGQKMAGHMGNERQTVLNLLVVQTDPARNLLFVQGAVPGPARGLVTVSLGRRKPLADFRAPEPLASPEPEAEPEPVVAPEPEAVDEPAPEAVDEPAPAEAEAGADEAGADGAGADEAVGDEGGAVDAGADESAPEAEAEAGTAAAADETDEEKAE